MTARAIFFAVFLLTLLALGVGASRASSGPVAAAATNTLSAAFCSTVARSTHKQTNHTSIHNRIAFRCYCCGRDENGVCIHQCCE